MHDNSQTILFANDFINQRSLLSEIQQIEERQHFSTASTNWEISSYGRIKNFSGSVPDIDPHFFFFFNLTF